MVAIALKISSLFFHSIFWMKTGSAEIQFLLIELRSTCVTIISIHCKPNTELNNQIEPMH